MTVEHSEGWDVFTGRAKYQIIPSVILEKHVQSEWKFCGVLTLIMWVAERMCCSVVKKSFS